MSKLAVHLNESIHLNNKNTEDIACMQLTISYNKREKVVKEVMHEVKDLLEYNLNKEILDWGVRKEICKHIDEAGFKTYGRCRNLDMIEVVDYIFLGNKMVIITKIPIKNQVDNFRLTNIISMLSTSMGISTKQRMWM